MRGYVAGAALLASCALAGCMETTGGAAPEVATGCVEPAVAAQMREAAAARSAAVRSREGQSILRPDARLAQAAQNHACFLARDGQMSHRGDGGTNSMQRAQAAGYPARIAAENLAWGYRDGAQVAGFWDGSPPHHRNLVHPRLTHYGIGVAEGPNGPMWVQLMAGGG